MLGSSRSLLKALAIVFESWDNDADWRSCPPALIKSLYDVIFAYTDRHNSANNLSTSINDELRTIYHENIESSDQLSKEIFFLDLLIRLLPLLSNADLELWLETYLRPALDSAGFDFEFVSKCTQFIEVLTDDSFTSEDVSLVQSREALSQYIMERILRVYTAKDPNVYQAIGIRFTEAERSTQIHTERVRFIERNCALLIEKWCILRPKMCFTLLNKFFLDPASRLKATAIFTLLASCKSSLVHLVVETPLYVNLLRSLSYDTSEAILGSGLGILLMLMGKVCHKVSSHLPDLFGVYARLLLWNKIRIEDTASASKEQWSIVKLNTNGFLMKSHLFSEDSFNVSYLQTLLYGLFPLNLMEFLRSPLEYWTNHSPRIISLDFLRQIDSVGEKSAVFAAIMDMSQHSMSRLMLHPNILRDVSKSNEIKSPINWILECCPGEDVGEQEVLLACLKLNPDLMISLPENVTTNNGLPSAASSKRNSFGDRHEFRRGQKSFSSGNLLRDGIAQLESLSPHSNEPSPTFAKPKHYVNWSERRVSIVPTKLSLEHYASPATSDTENGEIKFLSFEFNQSKSRSNSGPVDDLHIEPTKMGSIGDLFSAHEKLYASNDYTSGNGQPVKEKNSENAAGSFQASAKTASNLLSQQLNPDAHTDVTKESQTPFSGTAIDFYQRELLIMKNEVEFTSFLKNLNRTNYVKLKLQLNRMLKESVNKPYSESNVNDPEELKRLEETVQAFKEKYETAVSQHLTENSELLNKIKELRGLVSSLEDAVGLAQSSINEKELLLKIQSEKLTLADAKHVEVANQLKYALEQAQRVQAESATETKVKCRYDTDLNLTEEELKRVHITTEVSTLKEQLSRAISDCNNAKDELETTTKRYENELRLLKLNIGDSVREQTVQYDRKIRELNRIIVQFETTLDEKDSHIAQLSRPTPIQIPRTSNVNPLDTSFNNWEMNARASLSHSIEPGSVPKDFDFAERRMPSFNSLSLSSTPVQSTPHAPAWPNSSSNTRTSSLNNIPIIKGRGGYQKRSKKVM